MSEPDPKDPLTALPARVWYLTASGTEIWCRRPYTFVFSSSDGATSFAAQMSELDLEPIGVASTALLSSESVDALRAMAVTRIFVDPSVDPASGDVFGTILRLAEKQ